MGAPMSSSSRIMWKVSRCTLALGRPTSFTKRRASAAVLRKYDSKRLSVSTATTILGATSSA